MIDTAWHGRKNVAHGLIKFSTSVTGIVHIHSIATRGSVLE